VAMIITMTIAMAEASTKGLTMTSTKIRWQVQWGFDNRFYEGPTIGLTRVQR